MDLVKFLTKNNIISACQYGFQENKSTNDALADLCNHLQNQKAINKTTCGISIDLKKAFDTVDHAILKKKLYHYGIRGVPFNLFSDYLSNRHQFVYVNTVKSDSTLISTGVPQGSVLGPVLFLIYINDLPKATNLKTLLFADDTALFASEKNPALLKQIIATEINNIEKWLSINKLTLNLKKSCYVMFSKNKKTDIKNMVSVGGICLAQKAFTKYLGIQIDSLLNWKPHIKTLTSSISKSVGSLYKLKDRGGVEDTRLEAKAKAKDTKKIRGQGQGQGQPFRGQTLSRPRTGMLEAKAKDQGHKAQVLSKKKKKKKKKKRSSQKFFKRSPRKNPFQKIFQPLHKILTFQKIVLSSSRGQANFRGLEASRPRPRPRTSKSVLEDVLEAKDVLEDSTSAKRLHF